MAELPEDERIRLSFRRFVSVRRNLGYTLDYHAIVIQVSEITGWPYSKVFNACLDEDTGA